MKRLERKINIGISACQLGAKVRYNFKGWDMLGYLKREKELFIWHPICPEVLSELGVPRKPIRLVGGNGDDFWDNKAIVKNSNGQQVNHEIIRGMTESLEVLKRVKADVFIYMEGSPSCGVYRTTLKNSRLGKPPGIFGSLLLKENIFLIPSSDLQSPIKWWDWRRRMYAYVWLKEQNFEKADEIYEIWHTLKFLVQEINRQNADEIGRKLSMLKTYDFQKRNEIKKEIMDLLRKPSSTEKIKNMLWKNYKYLSKKYGLKSEKIMEPSELRNITHLAEEVLEIEKLSNLESLSFGSSPISIMLKKD